MNVQRGIGIAVLLALLSGYAARAAPSFQQTGNTLVMSNADVLLKYNLKAGTTDFYWQNSKKISAFYSGVGLSTGYIKGTSYNSWSYTVSGSNQVIVTATGAGLPAMKQYFTLDQNDSFLVRVDMTGTSLSANWMGPVVVDSTGSVALGVTNDNRALVVPFDNDGFVSYNAMPINNSSTGYEVAAFYDNTSRNGLVVGSVTHDTWKTGIFFSGANNQLSLMNVFGGATSPWDVAPHGYISGNTISSPTVFVGFGADWRVTMQNYAEENTLFAPRLAWTNGVPFGWNSWGVNQENVNYTDAIAASDFFYVNLMNNNFSDNGTVYINLDSFWNNLSNTQLQSFASHCHNHGQKAGIYLGPFTYWGTAAQGSNSLITGSSTYNWSDAYLRTSSGAVQTVDGGIALDPTHPGTKQMISYYINLFTNWGFDYVKLDFLSHGALEGVHYDTSVTTGIQAYNQGMQYVLNAINGRMFVSESIAPLFPYQYGHSRRIACDSYTSLISNTEYTMNSVSYGWWLDNLYQFNDPDVMVFNGYGATTNENQSRLINAAVTGVFLDGDDLTTTNGQSAAESCLTNAAIDSVARVGETFTPVEGNTGAGASSVLIRQSSASVWDVAVFNYTSSATNEIVDLTRAGLPAGAYFITDLWDGTSSIAAGSMEVALNPMQSALLQLTPFALTGLQWNGPAGSGVWDNGTSPDWLNLADDAQTVFTAGKQVLFDDAAGVATAVTINGPVSPGLITVNSRVNNFTFGGSGPLSGTGGLDKEGASTLTIDASGDFTGPVIVGGGALYAGNNSLDAASSITISNGATFDLAGSGFSLGTPVTISGLGVNGEGAIYNSYNDYPGETLAVTLAADSKFGGSARWDMDSGSISGPHNLTVDWSEAGGYGQWNSVAIGATVQDITLTNSSSLGMSGMDTSCQNPATLFDMAGGQLVLYSGGFNGSFSLETGAQLVVYSGNVNLGGSTLHLYGGSTAYLYSSGIAMTGNNLIFETGATLQTYYNGGNNPIANQVTLNGTPHFILGDHSMTFNGAIGGAGGFVLDYYNNEIILPEANTYSGPTIIGSSGNSPEVVLTGNGSISDSSLIFFGGSDPTVTHMDVTGRSDQTLTLAGGQTLAGIGAINGNLVVTSGATISPAGTNTTIGITTGANGTGTLAASGTVALNGTTVIKLNGSGVNDEVQSTGGALSYSGTLSLVNISGSPLANGNSFQIFSASSYSGSFASITPATPGAGLVWDTSQLGQGIIRVQPASSGSKITTMEISGGNIILSGSGGTAGAAYYLLTTTNLAASNWTVIATNNYDSSGNFRLTNAVTPGAKQQFFKFKQ